ncbi:hypothetical protein Sta7437_2672 [Stanieria cyanosphaera PCC 7437]|uniref:Uncharacterized protein n=1 Tax=Stanieria cyanosphaera (strain ATCC 29371 / PCC 7437) TaxID=111780 RepID=K9XVT8_STAC7|nr:hypothetical protein Sta7437_2672 [Stanieria cyanosphaera PCC 7437]
MRQDSKLIGVANVGEDLSKKVKEVIVIEKIKTKVLKLF